MTAFTCILKSWGTSKNRITHHEGHEEHEVYEKIFRDFRNLPAFVVSESFAYERGHADQ
jgi:hypothetical protein